MTFEEAMAFMRKGYTARRPHWKEDRRMCIVNMRSGTGEAPRLLWHPPESGDNWLYSKVTSVEGHCIVADDWEVSE